jgi:M6 family metalloprotease-like protein
MAARRIRQQPLCRRQPLPILRSALLIVLTLVCALQADAARPTEAMSERNRGGAAVPAQPLVGRLELLWGDPTGETSGENKSSGHAEHLFRVTLVDDGGGRHPLDPGQALRAAEDLYALFGKRVAVSTAPAIAKRGGASAARIIDAIVPVADLSPSKAGAFPTKIGGATVWVTLLCKFSDIATEPQTQNFFQSQYGSAAGQLGHYWQEVSHGQINLAGSFATNWATLPQPRSFYVPRDPITNRDQADLGKLFDDCVALHNPNVRFSANGGVQGMNLMFNGDLGGFAWGGGRCLRLEGINKCWSTTWNPPWSFNNMSILVHEMGHGYGLPHANNSDNDSDTYDNPWDVMSDASNNSVSNTIYGTLPKHISIYSRDRLGWVATARKLMIAPGTGVQSITIDRASLIGSSNVQMLILDDPTKSSRYYTIEVRTRTGDYENRLAGDAVIIHEVQTGRVSPAWSQDADNPPADSANNEGSMFKVGETWISPDYAFRVKIDAATAEGFVVTVRPAPRAVRAPVVETAPAAASPREPVAPKRPLLRGGGSRR